MRIWIVAALAAVASASVAQLANPAVETPYQAFEMMVPHPPVPATVGGERILAYELHVTNFARKPLSLAALDILDGASGARIATLEGDALARAANGIAGVKVDGVIAPGQRAILYVWLPTGEARPRTLRHRLWFTPQNAGQRIAVSGGGTPIAGDTTLVLGAPLRGGPWVAAYAPDMENGHRRYAYAVGGAARLPGRHAIDWMTATGFVPTSAGAAAGAEDGVGADVLAVADGLVVTAKDGFADRGGPAKSGGNIEDETGNMIVIDLGQGRFASYQHLKSGLMVKAGQRVKRGQRIARVGASGHVTRPHLHFSVATSAAPLSGEGLPYRLAAGRVVGSYASIQEVGTAKAWQRQDARPVRGMPAPNTVVTFD